VFRFPFLIAVALAVAFGGGIWSTLAALDATTGFGAIKLGPWEAFPRAQTAEADPYAKSHRANAGKLLYASAEGLTFTASTDDRGQRLNTACRYTVNGQTPAARLWTLYASGEDGQPPPSDSALPRALNSRIVTRPADGSLDIAVGATAQPGNWLAVSSGASPAGRPFLLTLTLFDTPAAGSSGLLDLSMPKIERTGCGNG
jgi:hypothetical protein